MFFLFRKKERTKEKSIAFGLFSRGFILTWALFRDYILGRDFRILELLISHRASGAYLGAALPLTLHRYLFRFGVPRAGVCFLRSLSPAVCSPLRRLRGGFGALPALDHISEPSAGSYPPAAIWLYSRRCFARARHKLERARELHRSYPASA